MTEEICKMITELATQGGSAAVWIFAMHIAASLIKTGMIIGGGLYAVMRISVAIASCKEK